jgi:hypothetical protein
MRFVDSLNQCTVLQWRILTLRATEDELLNLRWPHLIWGLFWVWMAGIGRAWDLKEASLFTRSGIGSIFYVVALTTFLFIFIWPLRPKDWSWRRMLTFVSMTGIVGLLYAIPLEMMLPTAQAVEGNTIFLFIVAIWRVLMLGMFLIRTTQLDRAAALIALVLPLSLIVNYLVWQEHLSETLSGMAGIPRYAVAIDPKKTLTEQEARKIGLYPVVDKTGRAKAQVYYVDLFPRGDFPDGFRMIDAKDPDYFPQDLLMVVVKPLGQFCQINTPILFLVYLYLAFTGNGRKFVPKAPDQPEEAI